jgi:hypothetical protein
MAVDHFSCVAVQIRDANPSHLCASDIENRKVHAGEPTQR